MTHAIYIILAFVFAGLIVLLDVQKTKQYGWKSQLGLFVFDAFLIVGLITFTIVHNYH